MALADEFMKSKDTAETEPEPEGNSAFAELRKRFLTGSDEEAEDAFQGLVALVPSEEEEEPPASRPGLKGMMSAAQE